MVNGIETTSQDPLPNTGWWVPKPQPDGETKAVPLLPSEPHKTILIGADLAPGPEEALLSTLRANRDIFTWEHEDLPGVPRTIIEHRLVVNPEARSIKQRLPRCPKSDKLQHETKLTSYSRLE